MKRILVVHYSQSGQLTRVLDAILAPLRKVQHTPLDIVELALEPVEPFPFPWGFMQFLDAFPESFLLKPRPLKPCRNWGASVSIWSFWVIRCGIWRHRSR